MLKHTIIFILTLFLFSAYSCDSGDIYPEKIVYEEINIHVDASFNLLNLNAFPSEDYQVVFGAFIGTSPFPLSYETLTKPENNNKVSILFDKLPKGTTYLSLALLNKVDNKKIYSFYQYPVNAETKEVNINETVNLATFSRVQEQVLTPQCILCHGFGGKAANLDLTVENAYENLFNTPANESNSPKNRVTAYSIQNSFLLDVLSENVPTVTTNHTTLTTLKTESDISLIRAWIESGAKND